MKSVHKILVMSSLALTLGGCTLIPNDGPSSFGVRMASYDHVRTRDADRSETKVDFVLIDANKRVVKALANMRNIQFEGSFSTRAPRPDIRIGVGDTITISIFEAGAGGLFTPTGVTLSQGNFVTLPAQEVDGSGRIKAPYAGWIEVAGRRVQDAEREIEKKLKNRAIEPQVVMNVTTRTANLVTVLGDVDSPGRFPIGLGSPRVDRVLDALGQAGGAEFQDYETLVTLTRGSKKATVRLSAITRSPRNDVYLYPDDVLFVQRDQRFFTVFGATGQQARLTFDQERLTVADGLGRANGLSDDVADPRWLVLYRTEKREIVEDLGANIPEQYHSATHIPVVYRFNLRNPEGFFFAKHIDMRNNDLLYASNAPIIGYSKLNAVIGQVDTTIGLTRNIHDNIKNFGVD